MRSERRTGFVDLEDFSDEEIKQIQEEFHFLHQKYGDSLSALHRWLHERADDLAGTRAKRNPRSAAAKKSN